MCLNFNFCLYLSSVMDFKSRISSSICGKLSIFKGPNKILNSISKVPFRQTKHFTKLHHTLLSTFYHRLVYSCGVVSCSSFIIFANQQYDWSSYFLRFLYGHMHGMQLDYHSVLRLLPDSDLNYTKVRFSPEGCRWIRP